MTTPTPSPALARAEQDAREAIDYAVANRFSRMDSSKKAMEEYESALDAYKAAILATVRGRVEACMRYTKEHPAEGVCWMTPDPKGQWLDRHHVRMAFDSVLSTLAAAPTEGTK